MAVVRFPVQMMGTVIINFFSPLASLGIEIDSQNSPQVLAFLAYTYNAHFSNAVQGGCPYQLVAKCANRHNNYQCNRYHQAEKKY
jgi:hypothetical protein